MHKDFSWACSQMSPTTARSGSNIEQAIFTYLPHCCESDVCLVIIKIMPTKNDYLNIGLTYFDTKLSYEILKETTWKLRGVSSEISRWRIMAVDFSLNNVNLIVWVILPH